MPIIDIVLLGLMLVALVTGWAKGILRSAGSLVNLVVGVWAAKSFSGMLQPVLAGWLPNADDQLLRIIAFLVIIVAVMLLVGWVVRLIEKLFKALMINWVNRLLGALVSLAVALFVMSLALNVYEFFDSRHPRETEKSAQTATVYPWVLQVAPGLFPGLDFSTWKLPELSVPELSVPDLNLPDIDLKKHLPDKKQSQEPSAPEPDGRLDI